MLHEMLETLDIHLLSVGCAKVGREWNYRNVNSFYNRLLLVLDGGALVSHHGREWRMERGDLHLIPCYQSTNYVCDDSLDVSYLSFTSRALGGVDICNLMDHDFQREARRSDHAFFEHLLELNPENALPVYDPAVELYGQYHEKQFSRYHERSARTQLENMSYISLMLAPFLDSLQSMQGGGNPARYRAFLQFVEENLSHSISVDDIASHLGLAPNYLSDWLSKNFGFRPGEYIARRRVEEAQMQLITLRKSIKEIAFGLGFSSVSYFSSAFKERTGISPSRYRALYQGTTPAV